MKQHKNSPARYNEENLIHFVVAKTYNNYQHFKNPIFCELLVEEIKLCKKLKNFKLYGFSIIYDHLNLLVQPGKDYNISKIMQFLKRHFTRDVNYIMGYSIIGDIRECRLCGGSYENYSKIIKNHDAMLKQLKIRFCQKHTSISPKFCWQKSFYDHVIIDERDFEHHYNYTVYNFQKHGLPNGWPYTSLNYNEMIDEILI